MGDEGGSRSLTRREFDAVIRRAAELSASDPEGGDGGLNEVELFRIASEVGLSNGHVRRALSEVRSGKEAGGFLDRVFGPASVRASRVVRGSVEPLADEIDEFLVATRLLQPMRRGVGLLQYRPAVDWMSEVARAASSSSRKYYIASAKSVEVRLEKVDEEHTLIEFLVDPGTRGPNVGGGAIFGGGAAAGVVGSLVTVGIASAGPFFALAVGVGIVAGAGMWTVVGYGVGRHHKKQLEEVRTEVEGVLDRLELGDSLEPPPASWRRWVKRHFHGVARDLMGTDDE